MKTGVPGTRLKLGIRTPIAAVLAAFIMIAPAWAQEGLGQAPEHAALAVPQSDWQPPEKKPADANPCPRVVSEKAFLKNLWCDQKVIWTAPLRAPRRLRFVLPFAGATAVLIATDKFAAREISERPPGGGFNASRYISYMGSPASTIGFAGAFYGVSRLTRNEGMRETALLSFEVLADAGIVQGVLKIATQRERPTQDNGRLRLDDARGKFWAGGSSFPSGHSISVWALASFFASRYPDKPVVKYTAYGLAVAVSVSRLTSRQHFPSDVLVGSVFGYLIGHYVTRAHTR
ncbi:MAG: phosphatase PAP2 family protein [Acidobacteriia bacterium]|nr:phosphatase PAP2 family protein [Terriglobia bacterium]